MAGWQWDETLYAGAADHYGAGRMAYPPELIEAFPLTGAERLLDVGCGPGSLTIPLAARVRSAVGIDADPGMIAAAERAGPPNAEWRCMRAEELPGDLGRFDVVTFAQSFHWFERETVARTVRGMLTPGGILVHVHATTNRGDASGGEPPPYERIDALVRAYLGPARRAGAGTLPQGTPSGESEIYRAAGFSGPERIEVDTGEVVTRSTDEIVAAVFSLSSSTPHLFGDDAGRFEAELRALLGDGPFSERRRPAILDVWR
jgi:SAM-dependent methyltransferase